MIEPYLQRTDSQLVIIGPVTIKDRYITGGVPDLEHYDKFKERYIAMVVPRSVVGETATLINDEYRMTRLIADTPPDVFLLGIGICFMSAREMIQNKLRYLINTKISRNEVSYQQLYRFSLNVIKAWGGDEIHDVNIFNKAARLTFDAPAFTYIYREELL